MPYNIKRTNITENIWDKNSKLPFIYSNTKGH